MHGGGSRGGPVTSSTRTTSRHSSLQRQAPRHVPIPNRMQLVRISALYLEQWLLSSTIFHYLSLPGACPHWKERALSRTIPWKERASSRSRKHVFHPDEFLRSRVTGQSTSGSACMRLPFPSPTYAHTHTWTKPAVSIDDFTVAALYFSFTTTSCIHCGVHFKILIVFAHCHFIYEVCQYLVNDYSA